MHDRRNCTDEEKATITMSKNIEGYRTLNMDVKNKYRKAEEEWI